jgi:hypothetical protein
MTSIVSKWSLKLIDDPRVVIYDCNKFIMQATGLIFVSKAGAFPNGTPSRLLALPPKIIYLSWGLGKEKHVSLLGLLTNKKVLFNN